MKKQGVLVESIINMLWEFGQLLPRPFEAPYEYIKRASGIKRKTYYDTVYNLNRKGTLKIISKNGKKFLQLTHKGYMEVLLKRLMHKTSVPWDGKWRIIIFDIPEDAKLQRDRLRRLLKKLQFVKLQASVFVNPFPLNRWAITYLKDSGLFAYIHIMRVDEMDDEKELKKKFKLV